MDIGDYVRTIRGQIGKLKKIEDKRCEIEFNGMWKDLISRESIIKSSPNILKLLEPMDLLYIDISPDNYGGIVIPKIPETQEELDRYIKRINSGEYILKYVVTHEQLENNMYKVGE